MKYHIKLWATALALTGALVVGGCSIHKHQVTVKKQGQQEVLAPKATLDSLDFRVTEIERRLDAARAARARAAHQGGVPAVQFH